MVERKKLGDKILGCNMHGDADLLCITKGNTFYNICVIT